MHNIISKLIQDEQKAREDFINLSYAEKKNVVMKSNKLTEGAKKKCLKKLHKLKRKGTTCKRTKLKNR